MHLTLLITAATAAVGISAPRAVPEHAPVAAVVMSADLLEADYQAPALVRAVVASGAEAWLAVPDAAAAKGLRAKLSAGGLGAAELAKVRAALLPHGNIWLRDYGPFMLDDGGALRFADLVYDGGTSVFEAFPKALAEAVGARRDVVPVAVDGGNFLAAGGVCFTSVESGAGPGAGLPAEQELADKHAAAVGCPRIVALRDPPHAHLDMWVKVVADDTALVNEVDAETLALAAQQAGGTVPAALAELKRNLDAQAQALAAHVKVERLPMPLPYRGAFRTYANALLVNGTAIVPSYRRYGWDYDDYPDAAHATRYERLATEAYARHGYRVTFVPADGLIYNGGAFHCIALQLPRLAGRIAALARRFKAKGF